MSVYLILLLSNAVVVVSNQLFTLSWINEWMNEYDLSDAITETVAEALNKIKF